MSELHTVEHTVEGRGAVPGENYSKGTRSAQKDWTIKGLPSETVTVAREAAKASGMKINAWVSQALSNAASEPKRENVQNLSKNHQDRIIDSEVESLRIKNEELVKTVNTLTALLAKSHLEK